MNIAKILVADESIEEVRRSRATMDIFAGLDVSASDARKNGESATTPSSAATAPASQATGAGGQRLPSGSVR